MSEQQSAYLEAAAGEKFPLKPEGTNFGRVGGGASVEIRDKSLSRVHAEIKLDGTRWLLTDLNSRNKTFLNEKPVPPEKPTPLSEGDEIHFGTYALHFHVGIPDATAAPVQDIDATLALDVSALPFDDMFIKAGMKSKASKSGKDGSASSGAGLLPSSIPASEAALAQSAFAYLELRSVTSPTRYYLTKPVVKVGSDAGSGCDIVIPDPGIEKSHVEIRFIGGHKIRMRNLSSSGTLLNGKRAGNIPIKDKDQIEIGDSSFTFKVLRFPEGDEKPAAKSNVALIGGIAALIILGVAGYLIKVNFLDAQEAAPAATVAQTAGNIATTTTQPTNVPIQRAIEQIRRLEFSNAAQTASALAADAEDAETKRRAQTLKDHLDRLLTAQAQVNNRMYLDARASLVSIPPGEVRDLAGEEIRRIDMLVTQFVNTTIAQIKEAEGREQWTQALGFLDTLRGNAEGLSINPAKVRQRIELKRRASEEIRLAGQSPLVDHYELTTQRVRNLLKEIEDKSAQEPALTDELDQYTRELRNVAAHADLIGEYLKYKGGSLDRIREIDAAIHPGYPAIRDVRRIVTNCERIQRLQASFETLNAELPTIEDGAEAVRKQEQLMQNRQEILTLEDSPKFQLAAQAREDLRKVQDFRKHMIVARWREAPSQSGSQDKEQLLASHVASRRHAFQVLSLFDPQVRRRIQSVSDIPLNLSEPELQAVYAGAMEAYSTSFTRATAVLYESIVDPSATFDRIRQDSAKLSTMLRDATLPEDENSRRQLDRLRDEQLRARPR